MFNNSTPFTMPVAPAYYGNGNSGLGGFGDGWLGLIVILALLGWGGNGFGSGFGGFGGGRGYEPCATQADVRAAVDQQTLISKIDQQTYGLSSTFTALNDNLNNNFRGIDNAICTLGYQNQQGFSNVSAQLASCCCETQRLLERGFADTNYNLATQACDIKHAINDSTRSILDFLTTDKIATLQAENQELRLKASQAKQNAYLVNELRPCPIPAYLTCNPYAASYGYGNGGYGYGNGCGCNA